jgi:sugar transferase (PEP-CTERM system associated)
MIRLFRVFVPIGVFTLLISEILLATFAFVLAGYLVLGVDPSVYLLYDGGLARLVPVILSIILGLHFQDLYSRVHVRSRVVLAQQLCLAIGVAFVVQAFISYLDPGMRVPIHVMVWGSGFTVAGLFLIRVLFSAYALSVVGGDRLLFVGGSPLLDDIARHIEEHPETGLVVAGFVDNVHDSDALQPGRKVLGPLAALTGIVRVTRPDRIVVGMSERRNSMPVNELLELRLAGNIVEEVGATYERVCGRVCIKELRPSQLIYSGELGPRPQNVMYQNLWNAALATIGVVVSAPLMLLTALAVRLSSPGPVLYRQVRVGLRGAPFTLYKFRSMRVDAEADTGAVWAAKHDPRVTPVGRWIRKLRFDELPQLLNVLKGEMSIVGPRPERPEFVKVLSEQIPFYGQRCCVRPGITGWAQINHKYGDTLEDTIKKLEYDLYYIKNMSLALDTYIIFHTIKAMLLSRGAQ